MEKVTTLARNNAKWNALKDENFHFYMIEDNALASTMQMAEVRHGFKASKMTLKACGFESNMSEEDMKAIIYKLERRLREKKETQFYHGKLPIAREGK
ncbi:hypothetical protein BDZ45DRAFT_748073 [Acephala macrosclerotiorum]|nr:hypothetical protein BDZ45DRAFT_748073 [Acephala macrosclerotiorum]